MKSLAQTLAAGTTLTVLTLVLCPSVGGAGDGAVALQTADPSCPDNSANTYVDCGNGTVTDNRTGLVWLKNANCLGAIDWRDATDIIPGLSDLPANLAAGVHDCGLSDGSSPGEWRLPSVAEWETMIADAVALGCVSSVLGGPSITNDAGTSCWQEGAGSSFTGVQSSTYWSSSTFVFSGANNDAFAAFLNTGLIDNEFKSTQLFVWPVRGGQ